MRRSIWRCGAFVFVLVLMLAFASAAAAKSKKPSLAVSAPTSVKNESTWSIVLTGYSGPYKTVMVATEKGSVACLGPERAFNKETKAVAKQRKFKVTFSYENTVGETPQTRTLCAYLFFKPNKYIVKTLHYQVV